MSVITAKIISDTNSVEGIIKDYFNDNKELLQDFKTYSTQNALIQSEYLATFQSKRPTTAILEKRNAALAKIRPFSEVLTEIFANYGYKLSFQPRNDYYCYVEVNGKKLLEHF